MASLDDVLSDKPIEQPKAEAPAEPKGEPLAEPTPPPAADGQPTTHNIRREHQKKEWAAQGRDPETGQFVSKPKEPEKKPEATKEPEKPAEAAKPAAPPQEEMTAKERAAFAAAADERRKRQALEQELAQLRQAQQPAKPADPAAPAKTFWDNPDEALKTEEQKRQATMVHTKLMTSEMIARSRYTDFDEKIATFKTLVEQNPALVQAWIASPDPATYAYNLAKNHAELQQVGGLEEMRKKIEADTAARVRKEVEAEQAAKAAEQEKLRAGLPGSLSDVRGATTGKTPAWGGPTPLGSILSGKP